MSEKNPTLDLLTPANPFAEKLGKWIQKNYQIILVLFFIMMLAFLGLQKFSSAQKEYERQHLLKTLSGVEKLSQVEGKEFDALFSELQSDLNTFPSLWGRFGGPVAQSAIKQGNGGELNQIKDKVSLVDSPYFEKFVQATFEIENGSYQKSATLCSELKFELDKFGQDLSPHYRYLYACNQLRLAFLFHALDDADKELEAIEAFTSLEKSPGFKEAYEKLSKDFKEGGVTLQSFLEFRKERLV